MYIQHLAASESSISCGITELSEFYGDAERTRNIVKELRSLDFEGAAIYIASINQEQFRKWHPHLTRAGFKASTTVINPNSGNKIRLYVRTSEDPILPLPERKPRVKKAKTTEEAIALKGDGKYFSK
jgi:hypothetical protein